MAGSSQAGLQLSRHVSPVEMQRPPGWLTLSFNSLLTWAAVRLFLKWLWWGRGRAIPRTLLRQLTMDIVVGGDVAEEAEIW